MSREPFSKADVDELAAQLRSQDKRISPARAQSMAAGRLMQKAGLYASAFLAKGGQESSEDLEDEAARKFNGLVSAIKSRDGCSGTVAMQKARKEHPEAYEAYRG